jgi:hypothetical protein
MHVDHQYVAVADAREPTSPSAHPFDWYSAGRLPELEMWEDTKLLAKVLFSCIDDLAVGELDGLAAVYGCGDSLTSSPSAASGVVVARVQPDLPSAMRHLLVQGKDSASSGSEAPWRPLWPRMPLVEAARSRSFPTVSGDAHCD